MFRFQIQNAIFFPQKIFDNNKLTDTSFASAPVPYSASDWLTLTQPLINLTNRGNQEQAIRSRVVKNLVGEKIRLHKQSILTGCKLFNGRP